MSAWALSRVSHTGGLVLLWMLTSCDPAPSDRGTEPWPGNRGGSGAVLPGANDDPEGRADAGADAPRSTDSGMLEVSDSGAPLLDAGDLGTSTSQDAGAAADSDGSAPANIELVPSDGYPTRYPRLSDARQQARSLAFQQQNSDKVCENIDPFGFTGTGLCLRDSILRVVIDESREQEMNSWSLAAIEHNRNFTGLTAEEELAMTVSVPQFGCVACDGSADDQQPIAWLTVFGNQVYEGLEVVSSTVRARTDSDGVTLIQGHHFPKIEIPQSDLVSLEAARASLVGLELGFSTFSGEPASVTIAADDIATEGVKRIVVLKSDEQIELRVVWQIVVGTSLTWRISVDTTFGDVVQIDQLFST